MQFLQMLCCFSLPRYGVRMYWRGSRGFHGFCPGSWLQEVWCVYGLGLWAQGLYVIGRRSCLPPPLAVTDIIIFLVPLSFGHARKHASNLETAETLSPEPYVI